jgi:hypothetical protein
MKNPDIGIDN